MREKKFTKKKVKKRKFVEKQQKIEEICEDPPSSLCVCESQETIPWIRYSDSWALIVVYGPWGITPTHLYHKI